MLEKFPLSKCPENILQLIIDNPKALKNVSTSCRELHKKLYPAYQQFSHKVKTYMATTFPNIHYDISYTHEEDFMVISTNYHSFQRNQESLCFQKTILNLFSVV